MVLNCGFKAREEYDKRTIGLSVGANNFWT